MSIKYKGRTIKYIASDLDGTLLFDEGHQLDNETYDLIKECIKRDVLFIVASGRTYSNELEVMKPIAKQVSYIAGNGSCCVHKGRELFSDCFELEDAKKVFDVVNEIGDCHLFISCQGRLFTNSRNKEFHRHMNEDVHLYVEPVDSFDQVAKHVDKISIFKFDGYHDVIDELRQRLPEIKVVTSGHQWVDFLPVHVNKGNALKQLLEKVGLRPEEGVAFGDQENDIEMIEIAGIGYGMKTGAKGLINAADCVIESAREKLEEILRS